MRPQVSSPANFSLATALDGVAYSVLANSGQYWRLGSTNTQWKGIIATLPPLPSPQSLQELAQNGIWLRQSSPADPLAVMCCGLGAVWPGMGRELYDNFPAARDAMDEIASYASWDLLALMDETDQEKIIQTRWQIPYLFMVEYAQWKQLVSLGLKPSLICGHSLGELVALCLAGVYPPEAAWYLLDTRAEHMAELEAKATRQSGMLAIPAEYSIISHVLAQWPDLRISNRNTPKQYILGGPRDSLMQARRFLRRQRIPAILLNMGLAFHNPAMRILRDLSLRRLSALEMHAPKVPILSCVTNGLYPDTQEEICRYIADLDENTVSWTESVQTMRARYGIKHFVEIGPQETLCGLVMEIEPQAACMASSKKGRETFAMRELCAQLFSMGHIKYCTVRRQKHDRATHALQTSEIQPASKTPNPAVFPTASLDEIPDTEIKALLEILSRLSGKPADTIAPYMDLRYDLALRSSSFPFLVQEAEQALGRQINMENLFQLSTVADLLRFLAGAQPPQKNVSGSSSLQHAYSFSSRPPLRRYKPTFKNEKPDLIAAPVDPAVYGKALEKDSLVILGIFDPDILPQIWLGLSPFKCSIAVPAPFVDACAPLAKAGCKILPMAFDPRPETGKFINVLEEICSASKKLAGILYAPPPDYWKIQPEAHNENRIDYDYRILYEAIASFLKRYNELNAKSAWLYSLCRIRYSQQDLSWEKAVACWHDFFSSLQPDVPYCDIMWLDSRVNPGRQNIAEAGDMFARELLHGQYRHVVWKPLQEDGVTSRTIPDFCPASEKLLQIAADLSQPLKPQAGLFQGTRHYSRFADPELASHGAANALYSPLKAAPGQLAYSSEPWLPLSQLLLSMLQSCQVLLPWLSVIGFSDLRVFHLPAIPFGITRQCRVSARAMPWLLQDYIITRLCRINIAVADLTDNGRKKDIYIPASDGVCILANDFPPVPGLWNDTSFNGLSDNGVMVAPQTQQEFYSALGFGDHWHFLQDFTICQSMEQNGCPQDDLALSPSHQAKIFLPPCTVDCGSNWVYKNIFHLIEAILQAALEALALEGLNGSGITPEKMAANLCKWRSFNIGYARFDLERAQKSSFMDLRLELRRSWQDSNLVRFDAQVCGSQPEPLLTLHHLEFDRIDTPEKLHNEAD